ncbi:hypothetical protein VZ95_10680 [Elstera litoralis]|uniref:Uncharacterized protein n=1 Tax=Elstera litoralis TaxID=552518 RepID=A0A0F3IS99_9PROT|nr:hypothetical protein [Elstera litoralis]KJV09566.1 hypothetical protein VZ95_10680 [Elstera litoralis]
MRSLLSAFLVGFLVLALGNAPGLTAWVRDVKPAVVADALLPWAEAWQSVPENLGIDGLLPWLRARRADLLEP